MTGLAEIQLNPRQNCLLQHLLVGQVGPQLGLGCHWGQSYLPRLL